MQQKAGADPYVDIQNATRNHQAEHGCGAYTFEDGPALLALVTQRLPERILELGTALGYTVCCMAGGNALAHADTVEADTEHVALARAHIARHVLAARVTVHAGQFDDVLSKLTPGYDMVFFDGFAPAPKTIARLRELLLSGGVLVCANLQLAYGHAAKQLEREFNNRRSWQPLAPIERGRTQVLVKLGV